MRGDLQAAKVCQIVAWSGGRQDPRLDEFLLNFEERPAQTEAEQQAICRAIAAAYAARYEQTHVDR